MEMSFLELAQRVRQECGVSGTGPSAVTGQIGGMRRIVDWVNTAWEEIQQLHEDWNFMRVAFSFTTTTSQQTYTPAQAGIAANFRRWIPETFRNYITTTGTTSELWLEFKDYMAWRDLFQFGAMRTLDSRPTVFTILPDKSIGLGPRPDSTGYTITGDYYRSATTLAADADVPDLPDEFHMLIVYKAMEYYALYEAAPEVLARAQSGYKRMLSKMERDQLPAIEDAEPLL